MSSIKEFLKPNLWKVGLTLVATISTSLIFTLELWDNHKIIEALVSPVFFVKLLGFFLVCGGDLGLGVGATFRITERFPGCSKAIELIASLVLYYLLASLIYFIFTKIKRKV